MTAPVIVVEQPGLLTTVQDVDGRLGYWMIGVPPSGAMDDLSLALVNRIVGNSRQAAGLEMTALGATLRFEADAVIALGGAEMAATVDGRPVPHWEPLPVTAGAVLSLGRIAGSGLRTYLAVGGGIDVPEVLESRATFTLGRFGGHQGRELAVDDRLPIGTPGLADNGDAAPFGLHPLARPALTDDWSIAVTEGPLGAPEYFTEDGVAELLAAVWTVQSHASRTGVRLSGPTPRWARVDGGEAGLHPSNIHDNGYAFGTVDFTGDTPVILGPDGPSLGGFTCPFTVVAAERWKLGQLAPGDTVRFRLVDLAGAAEVRAHRARTIALRRESTPRPTPRTVRPDDGGVLGRIDAGAHPEVVFRRAGDEFLLVELGDMTLDLRLRASVQLLEQALAARSLDGIVDVTAGIRSLLIHVDPVRLPIVKLLDEVTAAVEASPDPGALVIPSREVHLPLSWEDPSTLEAIERYMNVVRDDAPWCPSNLEFIRRVNGLDSIDDVRRVVFDAHYLVLGLGDVYLGAPVATPLDPRHRLVTTKYNPARTWTPQNAVGIGGAYLCIYGMEGPGGYQFVGRTVPVWYLDTPTPGPEPDTPWLLRTFDRLRFHPVSHEELTDLRADAEAGRLAIRIEDGSFSLADHEDWLATEADEIAAFRRRQQAAFAAEREEWRRLGELA
ncbi:MAG: 5-oxoprolinase/urea amidolyase family protein [Actinomycetota bacterium]